MGTVPPLDVRRICRECGEVFYVSSREADRRRRARQALPILCASCARVAQVGPGAPPWCDGTDKQLRCGACGGGFTVPASRLEWIMKHYGEDARLPTRCGNCRGHRPPPPRSVAPPMGDA